jgi:diacylglycerol O-acyltransferase
MKQLSGLDATFLYLETPQMPMHVGALHVLELPAGFKGRYVTTLRKHIASRLPVAPVLRRKLWRMPLNVANPAWVDAVPDLRQHIVEIKLPKGAGLRELEAEVSRLHPILLDRASRCGSSTSSRAWRLRPTATAAWACTASCTMPRWTARRRWRWPISSST